MSKDSEIDSKIDHQVYAWLKPQWQQLSEQIQSGRLPHALFLSGSIGIGKKALAHALGHRLLCKQPVKNTETSAVSACGQCNSCLLLAAGTHPDYYHIKPTPPENSKSKNPVLNTRINVIRQLCEKLSKTSQMSGYRVAIIEDADMINIASSNSLLKTLEEPGENTLLVLVTSAANRIPITIRSRCQQLKMMKPEFTQVKDWLMEKGSFSSTEHCEQTFRLVHNAPLAALNHDAEQEQRELLMNALMAGFNRENSLEYSLKLSQGNKQTLLEWMLDWVNDLVYLISDHETQRLVHNENRQQLVQIAERADKKRLFNLQTQILQTLQQGSIALNPQLLWENLLLSWNSL